MIQFIRRFFCLNSLLTVQLFCASMVLAAADQSTQGIVPAEMPPSSQSPADPPVTKDVPPVTDVAAQVKQGGGFNFATVDFTLPEKRNLAVLAGKSELSVFADADGQFLKSITENRTFDDESARKSGELSLPETVNAGRTFSRDNHAAISRTEQAKAQTGQALALLLPTVSVRANYGTENSQPSVAVDPATNLPVQSDTHDRTDFVLSIRQPLFDLPVFLEWQRRRQLEKSRSENYRVSDGDAYVSSVNAYLSLLSSRLQIDMTRDFETQLADLLTYIEKRAAAGAASVSDMNRVLARRQSTLSSRLELESAHAAAGIEFIRLTNLIPESIRIPVPDDVGASLIPQTFDKAVVEAMKSNPELTSLKAELQAAETDISAARGRYLPKVDAEYTDTYSQHAGGEPSAAGQRDKRLMVVLNWSLFNGGGDYKTQVERTERRREILYRLDDQRRRVIQALSANYATLATTRERITSGYQELKSISTAAEAMSKRMLSGNQSLLDLLDVYDRFLQARARLVSLHVLEMSTVTQLVRITLGTPQAPSENKTN